MQRKIHYTKIQQVKGYETKQQVLRKKYIIEIREI
jgi:hypothetical protein